ncbi:MAG: homoserine dehydrogenase, partial [Lautropia sp.]|nr:homoserine dehydrogenase [Lautropia sp.]
MKSIKVGLLGMGTVGGGVYEVLKTNGDEIARRAGCRIEVVRIAALDVERVRKIVGDAMPVSNKPMDIVDDPNVDVLVEVMGGTGLAREIVLAAIARGKQVVTANKALLAVHGNDIFAKAQEAGVMLAFEAAVAGGIPIVKALREGLAANQVEMLAGIINGTT